VPDYALRIRIRRKSAMTAPTKFGPFDIVPKADMPEGVIAFRGPDGAELCAACGCRVDGHCKVCGCQTGAGTDDECVCATAVPEIYVCVSCGHLFPTKWQMQVHRLPSPACLRAAVGAAGRFAEPPRFEPPLKAQRDKILRGR
jgi:hypothetical protein